MSSDIHTLIQKQAPTDLKDLLIYSIHIQLFKYIEKRDVKEV